MAQHFLRFDSLNWFEFENSADQVSAVFQNVLVVRKSELVILNPFVGLIYALRFEGSHSKGKLIDYNSERPNVGGIGMTNITLNNFRRDIVWRAANCFS